jgi:hypothetical protein
MTANELADALEGAGDNSFNDQASRMLRQQAEEIEALKSATIPYKDLHQVVKNVLAHPMRELTDEEIKQIFLEQTGFFFDDIPADGLALMDFARAILKKASKK